MRLPSVVTLGICSETLHNREVGIKHVEEVHVLYKVAIRIGPQQVPFYFRGYPFIYLEVPLKNPRSTPDWSPTVSEVPL